VKEALYPVEWCCEFDPQKVCWFRWLLEDAAYFNSVLFTVSAMQDIFIAGGPQIVPPPSQARNLVVYFSPRTHMYLRRSMQLLRESIQDRAMQLADTTAAVVVTLAMMAELVGDHDACRAHVQGLKQMVRMRGGLEAFKENRQMRTKICR
jgi:hypothetical protein